VHTGDRIIVISYAEYAEEELASYMPRVVHVNRKNEIVITDATVRELLS
jgi:aspartate 1-decarboxylase